MPREKRLLIDVSAKAHRKFKIEAAKSGKTMSKILCAYMEKFVAVDNPGDDVEKKTDNPGLDLKSPEEILADKILEGRKAWEDLKKLEKEPVIEEPVIEEPAIEEPVDESLKVHTVGNMGEIRYTKNPKKEPVDESLEVYTVEKPDEIRTTKKPVIEEPVIEEPVIEEPVEESAAEINPEPENRGEERRKKRWHSWIPYPFGFDPRKKQRRKK